MFVGPFEVLHGYPRKATCHVTTAQALFFFFFFSEPTMSGRVYFYEKIVLWKFTFVGEISVCSSLRIRYFVSLFLLEFVYMYLSFCFYFTGIMSNICDQCRRSRPSFDDHASCPQCRIAAGVCNVDVSNPCIICVNWTTRTWNKLRKSLVHARFRAARRGRQHWPFLILKRG